MSHKTRKPLIGDEPASGVSGKKGTRGRPVELPLVSFFAGRSQSFVQFGGGWRRMTPEGEARSHTGYQRETRESSIGVSIMRRPNGLLRVAFDLARLDLNLRPATIEHLRRRWHAEAATLSKSLHCSASRRAHFSKSFASFEIAPERIEEWEDVLEAVLSDVNTYEPISHNPTHV